MSKFNVQRWIQSHVHITGARGFDQRLTVTLQPAKPGCCSADAKCNSAREESPRG